MDIEHEIDELNRKILVALSIPTHRLAQPVNDGTWTTQWADMLDAAGCREEARAERIRVLGPEQ